ncbi:unnamed protein product [Soboliphyme baturini]|uniref:Uncharacterized protein n=1 Tax=Soboliphyme baturini TaxID=241478 RepID=A0A183IYI6_9BILA|nr:unnamed protein product [Soboliphyme baturini]
MPCYLVEQYNPLDVENTGMPGGTFGLGNDKNYGLCRVHRASNALNRSSRLRKLSQASVTLVTGANGREGPAVNSETIRSTAEIGQLHLTNMCTSAMSNGPERSSWKEASFEGAILVPKGEADHACRTRVAGSAKNASLSMDYVHLNIGTTYKLHY